jgi:hypothetical protein
MTEADAEDLRGSVWDGLVVDGLEILRLEGLGGEGVGSERNGLGVGLRFRLESPGARQRRTTAIDPPWACFWVVVVRQREHVGRQFLQRLWRSDAWRM